MFDNLINKRIMLTATVLILLAVISVLTLNPYSLETFAKASGSKRKIPIYSVETDKKIISLSFDAAWGADDTDELLSILKEEDILATFFLCGYWLDKYPEQVKKIFEAGHDIGNHGNTHAHGAQLSLSQNVAEIKNAHDKVKNLLGIDMDLYRPPFGEYNNTVVEAADSLGYYTIQWDVETTTI